MKSKTPTIEFTLFILIFLLGMLTRFYNLGAAPLSDAEADWALQALEVANPNLEILESQVGSQPAYVFLTAALFDLFGSNNFLARFWPSFAGVLLILLPILIRNKLGRITALILAFGLAIDPGLVTVSRQAGSPMMALSFGLLSLSLWYFEDSGFRAPILAGITFGLALLSGYEILIGASILLLTWYLYNFLKKRHFRNSEEKSGEPVDTIPKIQITLPQESFNQTVLLLAGLSILIVGTYFFQHPDGLANWFQMIPNYLSGWINPSGVKPIQLIAVLVLYQPLAIFLAMVGVTRWLIQHSLEEEIKPYLLTFPLLWVIISILLNLLYPSRQMSDLIWTLVPLLILAAYTLRLYLPQGKPNLISLLQGGLILVLSVLFWNTLIATSQIMTGSTLEAIGIRFGILIGILSLGGLTAVLVSLGWSWEISRNGLIYGITASLFIYGISSMWGAAQHRMNQPQEFWGRPPATGQSDLFLSTLKELSEWKTGFPQLIDAVSVADTPSIRWALRDYPNIHFASGLPTGTLPSVIITRMEQEAPALTTSYRGQDFVWWVNPGWIGSLPPSIVEWITFRKAPLLNEKLILWARSDLFPGMMTDTKLDTSNIP